jgi:hypothetical protein
VGILGGVTAGAALAEEVLGLIELDLDLVAAGLLSEEQACRAWVWNASPPHVGVGDQHGGRLGVAVMTTGYRS